MNPTKARVLFVDDEERIVNLLRLMFRGTYEVHTATSGAQALEIVRRQHIHVLVSDQRMPGMTGVELLGQVCRESPDTVRLLLTGYSDLAAIVGSVNEGEVFRFISKPWKHDEIRATMAEAAEIGLMSAGSSALPTPAEGVLAVAAAAGDPPGLLVLDDNDAVRAQVAAAIGTQFPIHHASSVEQALDVLENHDIGVMICEVQVRQQDTGALLHVLKNNFPSIITVMLTNAADSDLVIKLINQARIYRFATKPIRQAVLQLAVSAAVKEHLRCRNDRRQVARQRPVQVPGLAPTLARSILGGLKSLTMRWKLFSA